MKRKIEKAAVVAVTVANVFLCVCCTLQEDESYSSMAVKEDVDATVSEDGALILPSENETPTGIEEISEKTDSGEISEIVEEPSVNLEDKNMIFYVCDDKVWENDLFRAFLEGEATAYDRNQEKNMTWAEYFGQNMEYRYGFLEGVQLAAEDLDADGKEELMIMLDDRGESTDLYVFHIEDGKLYAWDRIENFYALQGVKVSLGEGGIFHDVWALDARSFIESAWRFNGNGEQEYIWYLDVETGHSVEEYGKEYEYTIDMDTKYTWSKESLYFYEDGERVREMSRIWQKLERQDWSEAELVEGDEEFDEVYFALYDALPETVEYFSLPKWADNAVEIPIWEVPGGEGWVSVEDPSTYLREFEYVGENIEGNEAEESEEEHTQTE